MLEGFKSWARENKLAAAGVIVVGLAAFGFLNLELIHFSSSPTFCRAACHTMWSEVDTWEISSHGKRHVLCTDCHYPEGVVNYLYFKMLALNDLKNTFTGNMGAALDHEEELDNPEHLHYISEDVWKSEQKMDQIILPQHIHNPAKDDGAVSNFADEKGNWKIKMHRYGVLRRAIETNCRNCHSSVGNRGRHSAKNVADFVVRNTLLNFTDKVEKRRKGIAIPHAIHLDKGIYCIDCHAEIVHGPKELKDANGAILPRMEICLSCHNDRRAPADCTLCHVVQKNMNMGIGGADVENTPNYMYPDNAQCSDCHLQQNEWKMKPEVCVGCHDDSFPDILAGWQEETKALLAELKPHLTEVEEALKVAKQKGRDVSKAQQLFEDAELNYRMVQDDGSKGAHNIDYVKLLMGSVKEKLSLAGELLAEY